MTRLLTAFTAVGASVLALQGCDNPNFDKPSRVIQEDQASESEERPQTTFKSDEFTGDFSVQTFSKKIRYSGPPISLSVLCKGHVEKRPESQCSFRFVLDGSRRQSGDQYTPNHLDIADSHTLRFVLDDKRYMLQGYKIDCLYSSCTLTFPLVQKELRMIANSRTAKARLEFEYPNGLDLSRSGQRPRTTEFEISDAFKEAITEVINQTFRPSAQEAPGWEEDNREQQAAESTSEQFPARPRLTYDEFVTIVETQFPELNPDSSLFKPAAVSDVKELTLLYMKSGHSKIASLERAVEVYYERPIR